MATRKLARGAQLQRSNGAVTPIWTKIAQAVTVDGPALAADTVEIDDHDVEAGWEVHLKTMLRSGEVTLQLNWDPTDASHAQLLTDLANMSVPATYRIVYPTASPNAIGPFSAWVTGFSPTAPSAGVLGANVTFKLTGQPTLPAA